MSTLIVDFSAVWWRQWHASGDEAVNYAFQRTLGQIREHAAQHVTTIITLDSRTSWRRDKWPDYKANRPAKDELSLEQMRRTIDALRADGFVMVELDGYEADDVIASLVAAIDGERVILSQDKDLLQLLGEGVTMYHLGRNQLVTADIIKAELGVDPGKVAEWLALTGDKSDNVPGVNGVGPKRATSLLVKYGSINGIYEALRDEKEQDEFTPVLSKALSAAATRAGCSIILALELVTLRPELAAACVTKELLELIKQPRTTKETMTIDAEFDEAPQVPPAADTIPQQPPAPPPPPSQPQQRAMVAAPQDWSRQLEPTDSRSAYGLAKVVVGSRMFSAYGTPEAAMLVIMAGREFGLGAMAALRSFHVVEGKPTMSAQAMMARCLEHPSCKLFRVVRSKCSNELATVEVQRHGWPEPETYTWGIEDAKRAGLASRPNWSKYPREMLINRCIAEASRFVWPEVMAGVYSPEEFGA
jgi:5'-3' exonuclease